MNAPKLFKICLASTTKPWCWPGAPVRLRLIRTGVDAQAQRAHLLERWAVQFAPHFALEEQTLLPALARAGHHAAVAIALAEHVALRALVERLRQGDAAALPLWGDAMASHVRFEERTLFPLAQTVFEPSELTDVMKPSAPSPSSST